MMIRFPKHSMSTDDYKSLGIVGITDVKVTKYDIFICVHFNCSSLTSLLGLGDSGKPLGVWVSSVITSHLVPELMSLYYNLGNGRCLKTPGNVQRRVLIKKLLGTVTEAEDRQRQLNSMLEESCEVVDILYGDDDDQEGSGPTVDTTNTLSSYDTLPDDFADALDSYPIKWTPHVLTLLLWTKGFVESLSKSTTWQIYSAFCKHYNKLDGDTYRGPWREDKDKKKWVRNLMNSGLVQDMMKACKNKDGETEWNHSQVMSYEAMEELYKWSCGICPDDYSIMDMDALAHATEHFFFRAFISVAFTLWTRNCETSSLQAKHINFNPEPCPGQTPFDTKPINISLCRQKGWQKKMAKGENQINGHFYRVYPQPDTGSSTFRPNSTLMLYLLDELHTYEEDHSDALCPINLKKSQSQLGEAAAMALLNTYEARMMISQLEQRLRLDVTNSITNSIHSLALALTWIHSPLNLPQSQHIHPPIHSQSELGLRPHPKTPHSAVSGHPQLAPSATWNISCTSVPSTSYMPIHFFPVPNVSCGSVNYNSQTASATRPDPIPNAPYLPNIPWLPVGLPVDRAWKQVIKDWESMDPKCGLNMALKDWPKDWYKGRKHAALYGDRKKIAIKYITHFKWNDVEFCAAYPEYKKGIYTLKGAILAKQIAQGRAKSQRSKLYWAVANVDDGREDSETEE
ncbi:hypothetical protein VNI00_012073 [Paramarasmius palmivorus]|uniref:Uncharacterized protein n=1 Tax=Paramarasmius palmivorus TaxID=297713 RepID=A0AAW0C940_9AGAR